MDVSILDGPVAQRIATGLELVAQKTGGITVNCEGFKITKVFDSIASMEEYSGSDLEIGDFVIVLSNNSDNGKTYLKTEAGYSYVNNFADFASFINADAITSFEIQSIFNTL